MTRNRCLWCGKKEGEVERLFPGPMVCICSSCIEGMRGKAAEEEQSLSELARREIDQAVQDGFRKMVTNLNLGPLQDKYQRLMRVKFKEDSEDTSFTDVFQEFKKGVEAEVPSDDYETRYDLGIAYHEMGLSEDAYREMLASLRGALRQGDYDRAGEIIGSLLYFHGDSARAIRGIFRTMAEAGVEC